MIGQRPEDVGEPRARIDIVQPAGLDQRLRDATRETEIKAALVGMPIKYTIQKI